MICVDRWSSFPLYKQLQTLSTQAIINILESWFNVLGWPSSIRSDGGPQFCGPFRAWCEKNNITHELSSPYNPKSNGQAESAVRNVKFLLSKCIETHQKVDEALYEWRNLVKSDGYSPAQLFFGRKQLTSLPAAPCHYNFYDASAAKQSKDDSFRLASQYHDRQKRFLPDLSVGSAVRLQDPKTNLWSATGVILARRPEGLSYEVESGSRPLLRSRKMIREEGVNKSTHDSPSEDAVLTLHPSSVRAQPPLQVSSGTPLSGSHHSSNHPCVPSQLVHPSLTGRSSRRGPVTRPATKTTEESPSWEAAAVSPISPASSPNQILTASSTSPRELPGSNLIGRASEGVSRASLSSSSSSSSCTSAGGRIVGPMPRPEKQSFAVMLSSLTERTQVRDSVYSTRSERILRIYFYMSV